MMEMEKGFIFKGKDPIGDTPIIRFQNSERKGIPPWFHILRIKSN